MNNKDMYRELCKMEQDIPIFSKDWWMDSVCGEEQWDVLIVEKGSQVVATLPYYMKKKCGFKYITQPQLTQSNGVWIKYPEEQKYSKKISYEKEIMTKIIDQLENLDIDYYNHNFHYSITNWLPFYWKGFSQTTRYTYVIENLSDVDKVFIDFDHAKRKNIKKAKEIVKIKFDLSAEEFYENHRMTLEKQNEKIIYTRELFKKIYDASYERKKGKIIYAIDSEQNIHAAMFVVWDNVSAYDLISSIDPDFRNSGAASLLVIEIIRYLKDYVKKFDFEGSMIENVENSFRQFGAVQKPYFNISKTNSKVLKLRNAVRSYYTKGGSSYK